MPLSANYQNHGLCDIVGPPPLVGNALVSVPCIPDGVLVQAGR